MWIKGRDGASPSAAIIVQARQVVGFMWGGSPEAVSKLRIRSEGPPVNRPGRQAGNGFDKEMSTEGAAQQRVSRLQRSSNPLNLSRPDGRAY
jgi:hypothetical protein